MDFDLLFLGFDEFFIQRNVRRYHIVLSAGSLRRVFMSISCTMNKDNKFSQGLKYFHYAKAVNFYMKLSGVRQR